MLRGLSSVVALAAVSCAATASQPRFPPDVAAAIVDQDMRRMETEGLIVYYPAVRHEQALRTTARISRCQEAAQRHTRLHGWPTREKPVIVMPELPFNNAYVFPRVLGYEEISVVPTENTLDFATPFGLPPDPAWVGCHEIVHYVHEQQFGGFWGVLNFVFGHVLSPQIGLDAWFWEGLATYYEGESGAAGRLHWPVFRGLFEAAYAGGGLDGDDFSEHKRLATVGHHYLVGSHFIEWLARRYGEERLWDVIARQGGAVTFALDLNGRFRRVYGRSLSALIEEFDDWLRTSMPPRPRPAAQRRIRGIGTDARYARAPDGTEAVVAAGLDVPTFLEVRGPDGTVKVHAALTDLIVPRRQVIAAPIFVSGMSFTADARTLYLTTLDLGTTYQTTRLVRVDVPSGDIDVVASGWGPGGAVSPDGSKYWVIDVDGDAWGLAEVDLKTRARRRVIAPAPGRFVRRVAPSPRGDRLAISRWNGQRFEIAVVDAADGREHAAIAAGIGQPVYDASWIDDQRLLYLSTVAGRFQATVLDLPSLTKSVVSDAPYAAFEPRAAGATIRFLDREGWDWELDEIAIPPAPAADLAAATSGPAEPGAPVDPYGPYGPYGVNVLSDRPYSIFDHLFYPQLHTIGVAAPSAEVALLGAGLAGGDRLGQQRWAISGFVQFAPDPPRFSVAGGYSNAMLAPWILSVEASRFRWHQPIETDPDMSGPESYEDRKAVDAVASVSRVLRGTTALALQGIYTKDNFADIDPRIRRLAGAGLAFDHDNVEATPYGGVRRRLGVSLDGAYYPEDLSTLGTDLTDTRAELLIGLPVIGTRRHVLSLDLRQRYLLTADTIPGLAPLEVSGGPFAILYSRRRPDIDIPDATEDLFFPERLRFTEPLRGFEELTFRAQGLGVAEASWTYPLIADYGAATSLYYFPSFFVRQVDLELFGVAAVIVPPDGDGGASTRHYAAGGAITMSFYFWRIPFLVQYQVARRFTDDELLTQQIGLAIGL